ncbi:unnamed protein product, partial [Pylaiella littoralis]
TSETGIALRSVVFGIFVVKLIVCNLGGLVRCMGAINDDTIMQLQFLKRYRRTSTARQALFGQSTKRVLAEQWAATVIQARIRQVRDRNRCIRRREVLAWQGD